MRRVLARRAAVGLALIIVATTFLWTTTARAQSDDLEAIRIDPKNAGAFAYRGEPGRAIENYTEAIRVDPSFPFAYTVRGLAHEQNGRSCLARIRNGVNQGNFARRIAHTSLLRT
jgi:hypothetical protein